mmetsp:Transcript_344/g.918  ORF Transcript_344/g.918 Transcript_344/m.918 type:complete len:265 (-) Transcript_344:2803-3597(-)
MASGVPSRMRLLCTLLQRRHNHNHEMVHRESQTQRSRLRPKRTWSSDGCTANWAAPGRCRGKISRGHCRVAARRKFRTAGLCCLTPRRTARRNRRRGVTQRKKIAFFSMHMPRWEASGLKLPHFFLAASHHMSRPIFAVSVASASAVALRRPASGQATCRRMTTSRVWTWKSTLTTQAQTRRRILSNRRSLRSEWRSASEQGVTEAPRLATALLARWYTSLERAGTSRRQPRPPRRSPSTCRRRSHLFHRTNLLATPQTVGALE